MQKENIVYFDAPTRTFNTSLDGMSEADLEDVQKALAPLGITFRRR